MPYRTKSIVFVACSAVVLAVLLSLPAVTQAPTPIPSVWLQSSSPGTAQTGNINVSGKYVGAISEGNAAAITLSANGNSARGLSVNATGNTASGVDSVGTFAGVIGTGGTIGVNGVSATGHGVVGSGAIYGIFGQVSSTAIAAVYGEHFAGGYGVYGNSNTGIGVYGTSNLYGVRGTVTSNGNGRVGVIGEFLGTGTGAGVSGTAVTNNAYAITGTNNAGIAVIGFSNNVNGYGVSGQNPPGVGVYGNGMKGVYGVGSSSDGVYGTTGSASAAGLSGQNTGSGYGVYASSVSGYGVQGSSGGYAGIYGFSSTNGLYGSTANAGASGCYGVNTSTGWGVYGASTGTGTGVQGYNPDATGYAVYAQGRLTVTGTKLFQIDYPFDPENKYLNHYCTEGDAPLNVYTGIVTTDGKGYSTIKLPEYFEEINRDPRVQLTVEDSGDDFVLVKSVTGVHGGAFTIRTSKPGTKVYWEVKAIRNDNYVRTYGFKDVEEKPAQYRGKYVNPEFFGLAKEKGQSYVAPAPLRVKR